MPIIGLSGAQGQGKTTLIKTLIGYYGPKYKSIDIQSSRELLSEWGFSLAEVNKYPPLKVKFQEALLARHANKLRQLSSNDITIVERTFVDIFVYALVSLGCYNEYSEWLDNYYEECLRCQKDLIYRTVYLSGRTYIPENDSVRSTNIHFAYMIDSLIKFYSLKFGEGNLAPIDTDDLQLRVSQLDDILSKIRLSKHAV